MTTKIRSAIALVCVAFLVSSCGFNEATDRENTIASGGFDLDSSVKVLATRVVSAEAGSGVLIGNLVNSAGSSDEHNKSITVESISGEGLATSGFTPIVVETGERVDLYDAPITVTGDSVKPGGVVHLTYSFSDGTDTTVIATVVLPCFEYAGIEVPGAESLTCEYGTAELPDHSGGEGSGEAEGH